MSVDEPTTIDYLPDAVLSDIFAEVLRIADPAPLLQPSPLAAVRLVCTRWLRVVRSMPQAKRGVMGCPLYEDHFFEGAGGRSEVLRTISVSAQLRGHGPRSKVYGVAWRASNDAVATLGNDGFLLVQMTSNQVWRRVSLGTSFSTTCAMSPSGTLVALGGLEHKASVYNVAHSAFRSDPQLRKRDLNAHKGNVNCVRFVDDGHVVTASCDSTCRLWDLNTSSTTLLVHEHTSEVMAVEVSPEDKRLFASGGCDHHLCIWDTRAKLSVIASLRTGDGDVNGVAWSRSGLAVAAASDGGCSLYDMRMRSELRKFELPGDSPGYATAAVLSASGRFVFACANNDMHVWDTLTGRLLRSVPHEKRVSSIGLSDDGTMLATGCWDSVVRVWTTAKLSDDKC